MGAGKSVVAWELSSRTGRRVISTDRFIEERQKRPITDIFNQSGEEHFRTLEEEAVNEISKQSDVIIDCGGGIVLNPQNIAHLRTNGIIFYLKATADVIYHRIKNEAHRPLLNMDNPKDKIRELLEKRETFYSQADYTIDANDPSIEPVCREILKIMKKP